MKIKIFKTKKILFLFLFIAIIISVVFVNHKSKQDAEVARAGAVDNVSGFAWSENIGWISFNSTDCDTDGNGAFDDGVAGCPSSGTAFFDYGVNVDNATGNFSGYAWSSNVGWIAFERVMVCNNDNSIYCRTDQNCIDAGASGPCGTVDPDPLPDGYGFNSNCDTASCTSGNNCTACHNSTNNNIYGWAKILSLGSDGWLKMRDSWTNGVSIDASDNDFNGWAWNEGGVNNTGIGWVSFNCDDTIPSSCATSDYKVTLNNPPIAINLSAPNWNYYNACSTAGAKNAILRWDFNDPDAGDAQSAYQVILDNNNDRASPNIKDTGKVPLPAGSAEQHSFGPGDLNYDIPYYWWVKVWDSKDAESGWVQFDTIQGHTLTDNVARNAIKNPVDPNLTFTTYLHEFPDVDFTPVPPYTPTPLVGEVFTDESSFYDSASPASSQLCSGSGSCTWEWSNPTISTIGTALIEFSTDEIPTITFNSSNSTTIELKVTDTPDSYSCSKSVIFNPSYPLPTWKEVKPL